MTEQTYKKLSVARRIAIVVLILYIALFFAAEASEFSADSFARGFYDLVSALKGNAYETNSVSLSDGGGDIVASFKNGVVRLNTSTFTVYSASLLEYSSHRVTLRAPEMRSDGDRVIVFDRGNTQLYLFDSFDEIFSATAYGAIINASVDETGYSCAVTSADGYKGAVTVYGRTGSVLMTWKCAECYLFDAVFGKDGRLFAIGYAPSVENTDVYVYEIDFKTGEEISKAVMRSRLPLCASYKTNGSVELLTLSSLYSVSGGKETLISDCPIPECFDFSEDYSLICVKASENTGEFRVTLRDYLGNMMFSSLFENILTVKCAGKNFFILTPSELFILDSTGAVLFNYEIDGNVSDICTDGQNIFCVSAHGISVLNQK